MAYLKPQSPIKFNEDHIYPLTTVDQIIMDDGNRLSGVGVYLENPDESEDTTTTETIDADTLGGILPSDFALKSEVENIETGLTELETDVTTNYLLKSETASNSNNAEQFNHFTFDAYNAYLSNLLYPVGAIYHENTGINPSALFGGTWELIRKSVNTEWLDFSWTNSTYIGTTQPCYTRNQWKIVDNVLHIQCGVGATSIINTAEELDIARIPVGNGIGSNSDYRIWNGAVGGGGAVGGFMLGQYNSSYITLRLKPHTSANNHAATWYSTYFVTPLEDGFTVADGYAYTTEYIWKRTA